MDTLKIIKALSCEPRLHILEWLKEPRKSFGAITQKPLQELDDVGVCVGLIQQKSGLSQSTVSHYLALLHEAGLVKMQRVGQWTFYQRNEAVIQGFLQQMSKQI